MLLILRGILTMLHVLFLLFAALPPARANDYYGEFIGDFKNR